MRYYKTIDARKGLFIRIIIVSIAAVLMMMSFSSCNLMSPYLKKSDKTFDTMENLIYVQNEADELIEKELQNGKNTFEKPFVILNPYKLAPLSALIVFRTAEPTEIEMAINDRDSIRFEESEYHALPVYGMYADYNNRVVITDNRGNSNELEIKTEAFDDAVLNVTKNELPKSDDVFLVSPDYEKTSVYDADGKLLWYLETDDNEGAVVFLDNGHFLISDPYQGVGGIRINYSSFLEMDYLGKVHKQYIGEYGYHHEIELIKDDSEFLLPGQDEDSQFRQGIIYTAGVKDMSVTNSVDLYKVFHDIAPKWTESLCKDGKFNLTINGADYDEESGDVVASLRATAMIVRLNLKTGTIRWIFADPAKVPKEMHQYLLKPADDTRYPYGQHATAFMPDGRISYHNNDVDFLAKDTKLSAFKGHYSSNVILDIDENNKTVRTEWSYDADEKILSKMSGSLEFLGKGHKLLSYGSAVKQEAYPKARDVDIMDPYYIEALMMELDDKDNVIWQASFPSIIHKVYKTKFYNTDSPLPNYENLKLSRYEIIDGQDTERHSGEKYDITPVSADLKSADTFPGDLSVLVNRAVVNCNYDQSDEVKLLFISDNNTGTIFTYKKSGEMPPIVNSERYGIRIAGLSGKQKAYVFIGNKWYDSGKIFEFD